MDSKRSTNTNCMKSDDGAPEHIRSVEVTEELILKYLSVTERAIAKAKIIAPEKSHLRKIADDFMLMATSYFKDAKYFYEQEDFVNAFGAVNYAHGWLDAGARIGLFEVDGDSVLFTLAE